MKMQYLFPNAQLCVERNGRVVAIIGLHEGDPHTSFSGHPLAFFDNGSAIPRGKATDNFRRLEGRE